MKCLIVAAIVIFGLAQQPPKPPEGGRTPKGASPQVGNQSSGPDENKNPATNYFFVEQNQPASQANDAKQTDENIRIQGKLVLFTGLLVVVGFLQVAALIWQGVVFVRTLRAVNRQADQMVTASKQTDTVIQTMQDTAQRQLRAYMCVTASLMKLNDPNIPEAQVHIRNCGQTPAYDVRQWVNIRMAAHPLTFVLPEAPESLRTSKATVAPGHHNIMIAPHNPPIPPHILALVGTPQYTIYVYGWISYKDIFGVERFTKYRLFYGGAEGPRITTDSKGVKIGLLKPDTEGNEAT